MSAVLKRKIEARSGVPPNILHMRAFWEQLQINTRTWVLETFGVETNPTVATRQVISGKTARDILDGQFSFAFPAELSPGLCAIAMDTHAATHNASSRLGQDREAFQDASPLFLKLLCEQPAIALWQCVAEGMMDHQLSIDTISVADVSSAVGGFGHASRYLQVGIQFMLEDQSSQVLMMFDFEYVQRYIREYKQKTEDTSEQNCLQSKKALRQSVRASSIVLDAVLERLTLTIGECSELAEGQILPLSGVDLGHLSLCAETVNGRVDIGHGEIGTWKQQRAVKLHTPIIESFAQDLAD